MKIFYYHLKDKTKINNFILENGGHLLQSYDWGKFQESEGHQIYRLGVESGSEILIYVQALIYKLPLNKSYLYIPRGPVFNKSSKNSDRQKILEIILNELKKLAKNNRAIFIKIDPEIERGTEEERLYTDAGFIVSSKKIQPADTLILNIGGSEEEILQPMHHKTRYNIRLSARKEVKVRIGKDERDVAAFYNLMAMTADRDNFKPHSKNYYHNQLKILGTDNLVKLYLAEKDHHIIAGIIVSFWGGRATYLHGALDSQYRKFMAPHLLQWEAILDAKKNGCKEYDMWGIAPKDHDNQHPWSGITRFKEGFGGKKLYFAGPFDLVLQKFWYRLYKLASVKKA